MNRHVLFIASDFPPLAGTNTQRVQSFARHLTKFGWEPIIVTRAIEDLALIDSSQLERLRGDLSVHRVRDPDIFAWLKRRSGVKAVDVCAENKGPLSDNDPVARKLVKPALQKKSALRKGLSLASRVVIALRRCFSYLPDALAPWAHASVKRGVSICREQNVQAVVASAPSYSCLVAGLAVAKKCGLPFVADFRDLWVGRPYRRVLSRWHDWWDRYLERKVVLGAHCIILASPPWIDHFEQRYGKLVADKCVVITNGYDETLIPQGDGPLSPDDVTTFLNTGAMYGSESPAPFLEALGRVLLRLPDLRNRVRVRLIGYAGDDEETLRQIVDRWNLSSLVELTGPKPHDMCLIEQRNANILLLFSGVEHRDTIRGKSFEYMATGKPILALIPGHGVQANLLREAGTAVIVEHNDVNAAEYAIEELLTSPEGPSTMPNWSFIRSFERAALTGKLAEALDKLSPRLNSTSHVG